MRPPGKGIFLWPGWHSQARATDLRADFDTAAIHRTASWCMLRHEALQQEQFDLWLRLAEGELTEPELIEQVADLMERSYERSYPLR